MSERYTTHDLEWTCPICGKKMESSVPYYGDVHCPEKEEHTRKLFKKAILSHLEQHARIKEMTPYEQCSKCGEHHLWEHMHMLDNEEVMCEQCYYEEYPYGTN